ncbi:uncharacterized protein Dsimw501_GD28982, isoform B [Drosophila simulans]|uniref:Uncharacterized protein, isoform B n=1 Tax=Drosophila simulans TaxID=7240 RepID=A0A0J9RIB2_DROSI|nr:uncharacterized protein Dsimw501_GD28982, isoform B [Drosophila simulans]
MPHLRTTYPEKGYLEKLKGNGNKGAEKILSGYCSRRPARNGGKRTWQGAPLNCELLVVAIVVICLFNAFPG